MNQGWARADKAYRKKVILIYVVVGSIGAAAIGWGLPWLREHLQNLDPEEALRFMKVVLVAAFLGTFPIALYLFIFGRRVVSAERFPPPGVKVIRDTAILAGEKAKQRGRVIVVLSLILALLGLLGALYIPYLLEKVSIRNPAIISEGGAEWD